MKEDVKKKKSMLTSCAEQLTLVKHCVHTEMIPTDTYTFLTRDKSKSTCSKALLFCWHKCFSDRNEDLGDLKHSCKPSGVSECKLQSVREMLQEDWQRTVREICDSV